MNLQNEEKSIKEDQHATCNWAIKYMKFSYDKFEIWYVRDQ